MAEDMRIVELHRVHHAGLVVCAVVLSAFEQGSDTEGRWLDAQRVHEELGGPVSGSTSFRNMGRKMFPVMQTMLRRRVEELIRETQSHQQAVLDLDLDVDVTDGEGRTIIARVGCVPVDGEDHYYLTTLPRVTFTPFDLAELYRVRWGVELFFRNWKGGVRMDHVHRLRNPTSLAVAVVASMLAALLSRDIATCLERLQEEDLALAQASAPRQTMPAPRPFPPSGVDAGRALRVHSTRSSPRST